MNKNKKVETREEFDSLVKFIQEKMKDWRFSPGDDGFEEGFIWSNELKLEAVGWLVHESSSGAGEKYQEYSEIYEFVVGEEVLYCEYSYCGTGSYYSDTEYSGYRLQQVKKETRMVEVTTFKPI